jgi:hypothetical protein
MKTEVYSWRLSTDLKAGLEREARRRKVSISRVLELAACELLKNSGSDDEEQQRSLHETVAKCVGTLSGGDARASENVRKLVREKLRRRYGR